MKMSVLQLAGSVVIRPKIARTSEIVWQLKVDLKLSSNEFGKLMKIFLWHSPWIYSNCVEWCFTLF